MKVNCLRGPVGFDHAAVILLANAKIEIHTEPETEGVEVRLAALNGRRALPFQEADLPVKGFIQNVLAREFGSRDLSVCQKEKKNIVLDLAKELETHFAQYGITISNVGIADGMSYDNAEVQKTIDAVFVNETRVKQAEQEREAQKIINEKELSIAQNERLKAEEFAKAAEAQTKMVELKIRQMEAEARLESAKRWDGKTPSGGVPSNSPFLFQFGSGK